MEPRREPIEVGKKNCRKSVTNRKPVNVSRKGFWENTRFIGSNAQLPKNDFWGEFSQVLWGTFDWKVFSKFSLDDRKCCFRDIIICIRTTRKGSLTSQGSDSAIPLHSPKTFVDQLQKCFDFLVISIRRIFFWFFPPRRIETLALTCLCKAYSLHGFFNDRAALLFIIY